MIPTVKDLLGLLGDRRKQLKVPWNKLAAQAGVSAETVYNWYLFPNPNPRLQLWTYMIEATGTKVYVVNPHGERFSILTDSGAVNLVPLADRAAEKGTALYKIVQRSGKGNSRLYAWAAGNWVNLKTYLDTLALLDMTILVEVIPRHDA